MASETAAAEQLKVVGQRPLELEVAGSRVAKAPHASVMAVKRVNCILREMQDLVERSDSKKRDPYGA